MDFLEGLAKTLDAKGIAKYLDGMRLGRQYPLIDRILDGGLAERLEADRAAGKSFFTMAAEFRSEGFAVSPETVRSWCHELDLMAPSGDAA